MAQQKPKVPQQTLNTKIYFNMSIANKKGNNIL